MWNSYSFQPVGQWIGYYLTDLGAEECCRSLNPLLQSVVSIADAVWCSVVVEFYTEEIYVKRCPIPSLI